MDGIRLSHLLWRSNIPMINNRIKLSDVLLASGPWKTKMIKLCDHLLGTPIALAVPPKTPKHNSLPPSSRILIIRPGGMGDAIFLLPILKALRQQDPKRIINVLCESRNAAIFLSQPHLVNHTYLYSSLTDLRTLIKNSYDIVVDTEQWHYFSSLAGYFINSHQTVGFASRPLRKKLFHKAINYDPSAYELENFINLFKDILGATTSTPSIDNSFSLSEDMQSWANNMIQGTSCAISLGTHIPERRLTPQQVTALIGPLLTQHNHVLLLGGPDAMSLAKNITQEIDDQRLLNFTGKTSLIQTAALLQKSNLVIGSDSGILHLSCAVGTKTIALFGPGNTQKWAPRGEKHIVLHLNLPCSPCTFFGYTVPVCHGSCACMRNIDTKEILGKILPC
ncbi:MAG: glycosyltransferase family 9 protein [Candidatus Omnitrophica bacterium]|nr:glycosyltransferase family 9 protein [Candidatus Omnitrophota bacterium]